MALSHGLGFGFWNFAGALIRSVIRSRARGGRLVHGRSFTPSTREVVTPFTGRWFAGRHPGPTGPVGTRRIRPPGTSPRWLRAHGHRHLDHQVDNITDPRKGHRGRRH